MFLIVFIIDMSCCIVFADFCTHIFQESRTAEIKYGALRSALKHLKHTFGSSLLAHFETDDAFKAGQCATQLGVLLAHFRRISKSAEKFKAAVEPLSQEHRDELMKLFTFSTSVASVSSPKPKRSLRAVLSDVSVDSAGFPNITSSPGVKVDEFGFPMTPSPLKTAKVPHVKSPSPKHPDADEDALACSPPPVDKKVWHALKRPAAAPEVALKPKAVDKPKAHAKVGCGTGDFVIKSGTVKIGGGKHQTYLQHRPTPTASLQLICSVTDKMVAGCSKSHADVINMLLPMAKKPGATKAGIVKARDKLLEQL